MYTYLLNSSFQSLIKLRPVIQNCTGYGTILKTLANHSVYLFLVHESTTYRQQTSRELGAQYGLGEGICCSVVHEGQGSH